jgi:hypothetical protein
VSGREFQLGRPFTPAMGPPSSLAASAWQPSPGPASRSKSTTGGNGGVMDQNSASWNRVSSWLRQIEVLSQAA